MWVINVKWAFAGLINDDVNENGKLHLLHASRSQVQWNG